LLNIKCPQLSKPKAKGGCGKEPKFHQVTVHMWWILLSHEATGEVLWVEVKRRNWHWKVTSCDSNNMVDVVDLNFIHTVHTYIDTYTFIHTICGVEIYNIVVFDTQWTAIYYRALIWWLAQNEESGLRCATS